MGLFSKKRFKPLPKPDKPVYIKVVRVNQKPVYTGPYDECSVCGPFARGTIRRRLVWDGSKFLCSRCAHEIHGNSVLCLVSSTYVS